MQVTVLSSGNKLDDFLQRCGGGVGKVKKGAKSGASWGGCVVLFSDKKQTSPLYKSLAAQYAGKLAFAEVCTALSHPLPAKLPHLKSPAGWAPRKPEMHAPAVRCGASWASCRED